MTWALELRAMPNRPALTVKALPAWVLTLCLTGAAPVSAQAPDQEPKVPVAIDAGDAAPVTTESAETVEAAPSDAPSDSDAVMDYEAEKTISMEKPARFPVDI